MGSFSLLVQVSPVCWAGASHACLSGRISPTLKRSVDGLVDRRNLQGSAVSKEFVVLDQTLSTAPAERTKLAVSGLTLGLNQPTLQREPRNENPADANLFSGRCTREAHKKSKSTKIQRHHEGTQQTYDLDHGECRPFCDLSGGQ